VKQLENTHEAVRLNNVSVVYEGENRPAIQNINLTVKSGELIHIVGPNGAGKTTLLDTMNGLLPPAKGEVSVFGVDLRKNPRKIRSQIGYVPQDFMVNPNEPYTAFDVVLMGRFGKLGPITRSNKSDTDKTYEAMELLGISHLAGKPVGKLSGGQQQKVMISRALAKEPKMLLLDEPFSNLDPDSRKTVMAIAEDLNKKVGLTTIIVTHETSSLMQTCHRAIVMLNGEILVDATPEKAAEILKEPLFCLSRIPQ